jgi:hypothetical protein
MQPTEKGYADLAKGFSDLAKAYERSFGEKEKLLAERDDLRWQRLAFAGLALASLSFSVHLMILVFAA